MLIKMDDYAVHQTAEPLSYLATSERNGYERYLFIGYSKDADFYFGVAFAVYPNRDVMDCAFSFMTADGKQECFRASRRCPRDRTELKVGPLTLLIEDPMREIRILLEPNDTGIAADLRFIARTVAHEEPPDDLHRGRRLVMRATRYTQFGTWEGHVAIDGARHAITPDRVYGIRDRSWGWRTVGEPEGGANTTDSLIRNQFFGMWAPLHWEDGCSVFGVYESPQGRRSKQFAQLFDVFPRGSGFDPTDEAGFREIAPGEHRLTFRKGSRRIGPGEIDLIVDGKVRTITFEPLLSFPLIGIGYWHPEWGHGIWKGEEAITRETWNVADLDPLANEHQQVQHFVRCRMGDKVGWGHFEQFFFGPHERYGFSELLDPA